MHADENRRSKLNRAQKIAWAGVLLLALFACSRGDERKVKSAVRGFYDTYLKVRPSGVPTKAQQNDFKKLVSSGLSNLLDEAATLEDTSRAPESPAPPRLEGDVFTSLDEGAISYQISRCDLESSTAMCVVELTNIDDQNRGKLSWKDRVFLVRENDRWVVDDIEYFGDKQFMHKGRLKDVLKQVIKDGSEPMV
ncbi:MAG TPA: hypothetical protein VHL99_02675 [Candidatus Binatia bacterium]|jgi:hypothetical protein|nr:hypothetical protein [Candidatus Binatia bacterium]